GRADRDVAAVRQYDLADDVEPEPEAARFVSSSARRPTPARLEEVGQHVPRNGRSRVRGLEDDALAVVPQVDADGAVLWAVLERVADDVREHLRHAVRVPVAPRVSSRFELDRPLRIGELELLDDRFAQLAQVHAPGMDGEPAAEPAAREVEK